MEVIVFAGTAVTVMAADPATPFEVALIRAEPAATPVTSPEALTVAIADDEELQATEELTSAVEPSEYFAIALSCCVAPAVMLALAGETAMELNVFGAGAAAATAIAAAAETPLTVAVICADPAATPVTSPDALTVATLVDEELQFADELRFAVEPSE